MSEKKDYVVNGVTISMVITPIGPVGETHITQAQWKAVMGEGTEPEKLWRKKGDNYPVTFVSWYDAQEFCKKLSEITGEKFTLPTDVQHREFALAGRKEMPEDIMDEAVCEREYDDMPEVASLRPNPWGIFDAVGLVWAWNQNGPDDKEDEDVDNVEEDE